MLTEALDLQRHGIDGFFDPCEARLDHTLVNRPRRRAAIQIRDHVARNARRDRRHGEDDEQEDDYKRKDDDHGIRNGLEMSPPLRQDWRST